MALSREQFQQLRDKGLSVDQIVKFERGGTPAAKPLVQQGYKNVIPLMPQNPNITLNQPKEILKQGLVAPLVNTPLSIGRKVEDIVRAPVEFGKLVKEQGYTQAATNVGQGIGDIERGIGRGIMNFGKNVIGGAKFLAQEPKQAIQALPETLSNIGYGLAKGIQKLAVEDPTALPLILQGAGETYSRMTGKPATDVIHNIANPVVSRGRNLAVKMESYVYPLKSPEKLTQAANAKTHATATKAGLKDRDINYLQNSSEADKELYRRQFDIAQRGAKDTSVAARNRPAEVAGQALLDEAKHINNQRKIIGQQLGDAVNKMPNKPIDVTTQYNNFVNGTQNSPGLQQMGITIDKGGTLNFSNSRYANIPTAQKHIQQAFDLVRPDKTGLIARTPKQIQTGRQSLFETMKFGKQTNELPDTARALVNSIYKSLDDPLAELSPSYASHAMQYAKARQALNEFNRLMGKDFALYDDLAPVRAGEVGLRVLGNANSRVLNTLNDIDRLARELGYSSKVDTIKQFIFSDFIEQSPIGYQAPRGFGGGVAKGLTEADKLGIGLDVVTGDAPGLMRRGINYISNYLSTPADEAQLKAIQELIGYKGAGGVSGIPGAPTGPAGGITVYRGEGGTLTKELTQRGAGPVFGSGTYYSTSKDIAKKFGQNITQETLTLQPSEILKISSTKQYTDLVKQALKKFPNLSDAERLPAYAKELGYKAIMGTGSFDDLAGINVLDDIGTSNLKHSLEVSTSIEGAGLGGTGLKESSLINNKEFIAGRIDDVVYKLNAAAPGLGQEYLKRVQDIPNPTLKSLRSEAIRLVDENKQMLGGSVMGAVQSFSESVRKRLEEYFEPDPDDMRERDSLREAGGANTTSYLADMMKKPYGARIFKELQSVLKERLSPKREQNVDISQPALVLGKGALDYANAQEKTRFVGQIDKKPRFEIDDKKVKLNLDDAVERHRGIKEWKGKKLIQDWELGEILDHPELYKNYPDMAHMPVVIGKLPYPLMAGYEETEDRIFLNEVARTKDMKQMTSNLLHELQHAIQLREDFATGGSIDSYSKDPRIGMPGTPGIGQFEYYESLPGEVEARNVQHRYESGKDYFNDKFRFKPFPETLPVSYKRQINTDFSKPLFGPYPPVVSPEEQKEVRERVPVTQPLNIKEGGSIPSHSTKDVAVPATKKFIDRNYLVDTLGEKKLLKLASKSGFKQGGKIISRDYGVGKKSGEGLDKYISFVLEKVDEFRKQGYSDEEIVKSISSSPPIRSK